VGKEFACNAGYTGDVGSIPALGRSPRGRKWQPTPIFLPENSHGQSSLGLGKIRKKKLAIRDKWCQIQLEVMECRQMGIPRGRKHGKIFHRSSGKNESEAKARKGNK